ncbi:hypothetical protein I316_06267 [Kwoniella heveanensis BCC8398]|uniref:Solute carrier family 30 (Zinc transporter), member 1 n=1 Tax=Kwoniella heveanensis BCC8398 TaxID=1296120 RepID=A0A1B9GMB3_9TREE|nr:hypothetical protein I316_06267 [Kwoniella heveanensis BCC8398]
MSQLTEKLPHISKDNRILLVIVVALSFFTLEVVVAFITKSLALLADAFHIFSDILGYAVAWLAARYANRAALGPKSAQFTFGYRKAEELGGFFNGAFLSALGVSVLLQSIDRFIEPSEIKNPILVMAVGAAGIGSNVLMLIILGGHGHTHGPEDSHGHSDETHEESHGRRGHEHKGQQHDGHAHARPREKKKKSFADINVLGILIHILGDAVNSIAVIISAGIYYATGFRYSDPIASVLVGAMIISTAMPLILRAGRSLLSAAPQHIDVDGVKEDIERISGKGTVHDLHVWSIDAKSPVASLHLLQSDDSLATFEKNAEAIRQCLHLWGLHNVTIQPETSLPAASGSAAQCDDTCDRDHDHELNDRQPSVQTIVTGREPREGSEAVPADVSTCARACFRRCHAVGDA